MLWVQKQRRNVDVNCSEAEGSLILASEKCLGVKCSRTVLSQGVLGLCGGLGILFNRNSCFTSDWSLNDSDLWVLWPGLTAEGLAVT